MGMRIGNAFAALAETNRSNNLDRNDVTRPRNVDVRPIGSRAADESRAPQFGRDRPEPPRVGFGNGTISAPGAAVRTIGRNFREARRLVPDVEELREEARERLAELREQTSREEREEREEPEPVNLAAERASARVRAQGQARNFINGLNQAAATAQARVRGEEPPAATMADIRVGDQTIAFRADANAPRFDIRV